MWKLLDKVFNKFKKYFTRLATFEWFVVIVIGLMVRSSSLGITSVIRAIPLCV